MLSHTGPNEDVKSGQEVAKLKNTETGVSRFHVDHWRQRLYRKTYYRAGVKHELQEWSVRLQHLGRREAFALGTVNATVAATKAKDIATCLEANGWAPTLAKFKPDPLEKAEVCTVGEYLKEVGERSHLKLISVARYAIKLRKLVADLADVDRGLGLKERRAKFDYVNGGRKAWVERVDGQRLDILSLDAVNAWRNAYVAKAGQDSMKRKSAERSAASIMRCSRALFGKDIVSLMKGRLKMPAVTPFAGVKLKDPGARRYRSDVSAEWILTCAENELRTERPQLYLALFLCLCAGLRRKEADLLTWSQVDFDNARIHIRTTAHYTPKTDESDRMIDLGDGAIKVLRSYNPGIRSVDQNGVNVYETEFVLDGGESNPDATYIYYRAMKTWRALTAWLQGKGITQRTPVHTLRKESGSLIASSFGIEAARAHLGHRDIRTTSAHYVSKLKRIEVPLLREKTDVSGGDTITFPGRSDERVS